MTDKKLSKLLLDIRIYSSRKEDSAALSLLPGAYLSERYALKLKELRFLTPGYDHIYLYLNTLANHGEAICTEEGGRVIKFECGLDEGTLRQKSALEVEDFFIGLITKALTFLSKRDGLDISLISKVEQLIRSERENLEINCIEKKVGRFIATVFFTLAKVSNLHIRLKDTSSGVSKSALLTELIDPRDSYLLVSKVIAVGEAILIFPRSLINAQMRFRNYYLLHLEKQGLLSDNGDAICISVDKIFSSN